MKTFEAKTIEEAVEAAAKELNVPNDQVHYIIREEKEGGLLGIGKSATIEVYSMEDVCAFGSDYLKNAIKSIGIEIEVKAEVNEENIIRMIINSERNPILIGRNGRTLRALNDLVRLAVSNHFKRRYRILLDVGDYKDKKYSKIIGIARRAAKEVSHQHIDIKLDPMSSDERRVIHQVLTNFPDVKTESIGDGEKRAVVIKYVGSEDHAFQTQEVYYKDIIGERDHHHHHGPRGPHGPRPGHRPLPPQDDVSLSDLLHKDVDVLGKEGPKDLPPHEHHPLPPHEEDGPHPHPEDHHDPLDDLPSASIVSPIINKDALKDLDEKEEPNPADKPDEDK